MNIDHVVKTIIYLSRDDDKHWRVVERFLLDREESGCHHINWQDLLEVPTELYDACAGLITLVNSSEPDYFHSESYARLLDDFGIPNSTKQVTGFYKFLNLGPKSQSTHTASLNTPEQQKVSIHRDLLWLWAALLICLVINLIGISHPVVDHIGIVILVLLAGRFVWKIVSADLFGRFKSDDEHLIKIKQFASTGLVRDLDSVTQIDGSVAVKDLFDIAKRIEYDLNQIKEINLAIPEIHVLSDDVRSMMHRLEIAYGSDLSALYEQLES